MDKRRAKRVATGMVATLLDEHRERLARVFGTPDDRDRVRTGLAELAAELHTRSGRTPGEAPDPNQVALFEAPVLAPRNACCGDTGYADYAAVPCPNPQCTAVTRIMIDAGMPVNDRDRERLNNEEARQ